MKFDSCLWKPGDAGILTAFQLKGPPMWLVGKKVSKNTEDQDLINAYKARGDRQALGILFDRYAHLVFGVCMKYLKDEDDSRDATLSIFEKLMEDLKRFEVRSFSHWIHSIARNHCLMMIRSRKPTVRVDDERWDSIQHHHGMQDDADTGSREATLVLLEDAIASLNDDQRICIEMFYLKKYCYQDVAEIGGYSLNEVKSHIQNGKRNLKIYMNRQNNEHARE